MRCERYPVFYDPAHAQPATDREAFVWSLSYEILERWCGVNLPQATHAMSSVWGDALRQALRDLMAYSGPTVMWIETTDSALRFEFPPADQPQTSAQAPA